MALRGVIGVSVVPPRTFLDTTIPRGHSPAVLKEIREMEQLGIQAAWLTNDFAGLDPLSLFAAAAAGTTRIKFGTAIVPTWPRHPIAMAQQVKVIAQLAPGRFRLGAGPGHKSVIEQMFGYEFRRPLANLREYVHIIKTLLREGSVDFDGYHYHAHARTPLSAPEVPVMISALQRNSFELAGEVADGAITWSCPASYLRDVGLPAIKEGAAKAGRPAPPLIAQTPVCVHDDPEEARQAAREQLPVFKGPLQLFYKQMLTTAGYPESGPGIWNEKLFQDLVVWGDEAQVAQRLKQRFALGISEIVAVPLAAGPDPAQSRARTLRLLGDLARQS